jgi:hypothetical protein
MIIAGVKGPTDSEVIQGLALILLIIIAGSALLGWLLSRFVQDQSTKKKAFWIVSISLFVAAVGGFLAFFAFIL